MIIIIEGVDDTGKTTLANAIIEYANGIGIPTHYEHAGPPGENALRDYAVAIQNAPQDHLTVFDRLHWGELVYGPHYRGESQIDQEGFMWLELVLASRAALTILCVDDPESIYDRVVSNDDDFVSHDRMHLTNLQDSFIQLTRSSQTVVISFAISSDVSVQDQAQVSVNYVAAKQHMSQVVLSRAKGHLIGHTDASLLLVGDQAAEINEVTLPFAPFGNTSGHYLMKTLGRTKMPTRVAITNSLNTDGELTDVSGIAYALNTYPTIIALGRLASGRLAKQDVTHFTVPHPQYIRRFHHGDFDTYASEIFTAGVALSARGGWRDP